jgi:hypothetical protein
LRKLYDSKQIEFLPISEEKNRIDQVEQFYKNPKNSKEYDVTYPTNEEESKVDIKSSLELIDKFKQTDQNSVFEFNAGLGRVTKNILVEKFKHVEALEPFKNLADKIKEIKSPNLKAVHNQRPENYEFSQKFDFIWGQWLLENMTDLDVIKFLIKCRDNLNENGKIVLKENIEQDSIYITEFGQRIRTKRVYMTLFQLAGLNVIYYKCWNSQCSSFDDFVLVKRKSSGLRK